VNLIVVTQPTAEPVTLAEARDQLNITHTTHDAFIAACVVAARQMAEHELQRSLVAQTFQLSLDEFPSGEIELPMGPIPQEGALSIVSVKYTDTAGVEQTVDPADYELDAYSNVPRLVPVDGWPTSSTEVMNAVRIRYTSGHASPGTVPLAVRQWILLQAADLYENRQATAAGTQPTYVGRLLDPYRSYR
jgi:uncharacterized phiE125 gp8 family phage protein